MSLGTKKGQEGGPQIVHHLLVALGRGVQAIILVQFRPGRYAFKEKRDEWDLILSSQLGENVRKAQGILGAIVGWKFHAGQDYLNSHGLEALNHLVQVGPSLF